MSLWPVQTISPCITYRSGTCVPPPGPASGYNKYLLTCPRSYRETVLPTLSAGFFYAPGVDRLIYHTALNKVEWPSWDAKRYEFDAATGALVGASSGEWVGIWGIAYTKNATAGSLGKIYACFASNTKIQEVSYSSLQPVAGGWWVDPYKNWNPKSIYQYAMVNQIDNLMVAAQNWTLDLWRNISTTPERWATLRLPNVISSICYESRKYCWVITVDGVILKANYLIPRWEMISTVQDPSADTLKYLITFDSKRNRVVVLRIRSDAADGACQIQLEFYYPMVKPATLTQPVPVTSLRSGNRVLLAANLIGDAGEGLTPYTVTGAMAPPVEGYLVTPFSGTEMNGRVCFQYQAPDIACTETLQLSVTVEEA